MLKQLKRFPYSIVKRLPSRAKVVMNHVLAKHFLVGLVAVVLNDRDEFLVLKHTYRRGFPFGLPSGRLKKNESPPEAMAREIGEESGLTVEFRRILKVEASGPPRSLDIWLLYRYLGGTFRASNEVSQARWVTLDTAPPLPEAQQDFMFRHWNELVQSVRQ
jgi:8-oxo-dGTP diphosphatase